MNRKSVAKAILEKVDDVERDDEDGDRDELGMAGPSDIDKVVADDPEEDPPFAPDANMTIKDQEVEGPPVPGGEVAPEADPRVEVLADAAHAAWSGWMRHLFGKSIENEDGTVTIPAEFVERWRRQVDMPYAELSDEEKESDREEARKYVAALEGPGELGVVPNEEPVAAEPPEGEREPYHSRRWRSIVISYCEFYHVD